MTATHQLIIIPAIYIPMNDKQVFGIPMVNLKALSVYEQVLLLDISSHQ